MAYLPPKPTNQAGSHTHGYLTSNGTTWSDTGTTTMTTLGEDLQGRPMAGGFFEIEAVFDAFMRGTLDTTRGHTNWVIAGITNDPANDCAYQLIHGYHAVYWENLYGNEKRWRPIRSMAQRKMYQSRDTAPFIETNDTVALIHEDTMYVSMRLVAHERLVSMNQPHTTIAVEGKVFDQILKLGPAAAVKARMTT